ncbi:uncharacterized protein BDCG_17682 [Blastomyces dermatitidis ER-3]|uniref:Uncharacterized protein n=1 Tax=Ajellomyces dermatitidis (strain ER-3 / ATCC MYA-2586) TaxID=559297 RepID=A0ABP2EMM4_AJEDR|nr:uncharacterized protein BDCG_17682 [Blastomyces dermatitidis ER-3]EEQ84618.2 hypothetical protein BDCG_17682 [Blastomyces dermatitidis ER-3]
MAARPERAGAYLNNSSKPEGELLPTPHAPAKSDGTLAGDELPMAASRGAGPFVGGEGRTSGVPEVMKLIFGMAWEG